MTQVNLEEVISDAVNDSELPADTLEASDASDTVTEDAPESTETDLEASSDTEEGSGSDSLEVGSPATRQAASQGKPEQNEFEKKFGIPAQGASGRENRIPHSRVQKMVAKAVKDAEASYTPKIQEYEAKVSEYEGRLRQVAEFENLMVNDSTKFLQLLNQLPQFQELLKPVFQPPQQVQDQTQPDPDGDMPQPDYTLADGSKVYSMEGLKQLNAWNRAKAREEARTEVLSEIEKRFGPIEQSFQAHQAYQEMAPKVHAQIQEARTWPLFNENESEITLALQQDRRLSLEGAYRKVVFPKITADRNRMREDLLREIKSAPSSTSAPSRAVRSAPTSGGNRSLEDIIRDQVNTNLR